MCGYRLEARYSRKSWGATPEIETLARLFRLALLFGLLCYPTWLPGAPVSTARAQAVVKSGGTAAVVQGDEAPMAVSAVCNPLNVCGDPDCSTAAKCTAGCFGNPVCVPQCGGSPCNVGCSLGVCGSGCPQECDPVTCPQNICATQCVDPNCVLVCGGSPCNSGCPNRCDPALCPTNALCVSSCGGDSCNVGCSPCEAGCPDECSPVVCPTNVLCRATCGGDSCNVGCDPGVCGSGCPQECDAVLCPQNTLTCILTLLNSVSNRVDTMITSATDARDRATEAGDHTSEMVGNMHDGLQNLTDEMRSRIQDGVQTLQQAVLDELAGATDFTNGPNSCSAECEAFRSDVVTLLTNVQDISNALLANSGVTGEADLSAEIDLINSLSGKALFPLYRVLQTLPILDDDFLSSISEIAADLVEVAPYLEDAVTARGTPVDVCTALAGNDALLEHLIFLASNIDKVGKGSEMAGAVLNAIGKTKISGRAGVWGWAGIKYTSALLERLGKHLESLGERLEPIAEKLETKLRYCVLKVGEEDLVTTLDADHEQFMTNDAEILNTLKALQAAYGNAADLNDDGAVNLQDYALFRNAFGSGGH